MLPLNSLSPCNKQPLSLPHIFYINNNNNNRSLTFPWQAHGGGRVFKGTSSNHSRLLSTSVVRAVEKDSQQYDYEIDPEKAREALLKLDQMLEDLSKKEISPPKIKATDVKLTRDEATEEEDVLDVSGSTLGYVATALFLFTIFYNILFYTVIKPSVDGPEPAPEPVAHTDIATTAESSSPGAAVLQLLPSAPQVFMQCHGGGC